jgi:hypothetical protein
VSIKAEGVQSKWVSSTKALGIEYAKANAQRLHAEINAIAELHGKDTIDGAQEAVDLFVSIPSIGMVKAGFIAQMCGFEVACLSYAAVRSATTLSYAAARVLSTGGIPGATM